MLLDALGDLVGRLDLLVLVEGAGEGDLIAHLGLALVDPGLRVIGQDFTGKVCVDVLIQRHVLRVPLGGVSHGLSLFQDFLPVLVQQGAFHRDLVVAQSYAVQHPALADEFRPGLQLPLIGLVPVLPVGPDDQLPAGLGDVHPLVADGLPAGLIALAGVNELDPPDMLRGLVLGDDPDVGGDAGVVEAVVGELHDGVQPVVFDQIPADLRLAGSGVPGEQGGAVLDDGHAALRLQFGQAVEQEQHLPVALAGKAGTEAASGTLLVLHLHRRGLPFPVDAEGGIGDAVVELVAIELVVVQGVAKLHIVRVTPTDQHVRLGDAEGEGVQLLAETGNIRVGVQLLQPLLHAGEHLAGAHGHVVDRLGDALPVEGVLVPRHQQVAHQVDDVPAGEMRSGFLVVGLGKPLDQILENIAHVHGADLFRTHIRLVRAEVHDDLIEQARLLHAVDLGAEIHTGEDVLHVVGETVEIGPEVVVDILGVRPQSLKGERACVVELVSGGSSKEPLLDRQMLHLLAGVQHRLMGGQQAVVKPLDHHHGQDHQAVFVGLECAKEGVRHIPNEGGLFLDVPAHRGQLFIRGHIKIALSVFFSGI